MTQDIVLTRLEEGVLVVTLNRPAAMNALSVALSLELTRVFARAAQSDVRAVVLTGAGRGFCAGADLRDARTGDVARESLRATYHPMVLALIALEKPVVAAVNGPAAGAGLALLLAADARIAAPAAKLVPAFATIGLVPDSGVGYLAARVLGYARALRWLAGGEPMLADEALARDVFEAVVDEPLPAAVALAKRLAAVPGRAYGLTKRMLWVEGRRLLATNLDLEVDLQQLAVSDPERAAARARVAENMGTKTPEKEQS
ncbi:enoyl-CoA hydratase-related protein [Microbacterium sp. zg-Y818]|uniref:enoyl-CoA hydratase-related protein n=1 Tax=unclassified Microbacterium TaxID=2609290 RepID=UPI00214BD5DC|nr:MULTISPECIES: enoyl-CoA hydratase-related protein [unclassified Microbacterium]MCR2799326.1 enoyl-CoA hydratase-related protein [Microbacterium sp. zg.Y818]WIM21327.1 enoyl-CoA hydratase-related protein [Microbacterium sp. zg-Y818]